MPGADATWNGHGFDCCRAYVDDDDDDDDDDAALLPKQSRHGPDADGDGGCPAGGLIDGGTGTGTGNRGGGGCWCLDTVEGGYEFGI